jgi:rare lipoprotein A
MQNDNPSIVAQELKKPKFGIPAIFAVCVGFSTGVVAPETLTASAGGSDRAPIVVYQASQVSSPAASPTPSPATPPRTAAASPAQSREVNTPVADAANWRDQARAGAPYQANGTWYVPTAEPGFAETGTAGVYPTGRNGRATASGEVFDAEAFTAAHTTLPLPGLVQVTNLENGRTIVVRLNDRGPFDGGNMITLSPAAARALASGASTRVHVRYIGEAPRLLPETTAALGRLESQNATLQPSASVRGVERVTPTVYVAPSQANVRAVGRFVQAGSFGDRANAERLAGSLSGAGGVRLDVVEVGGRAITRVLVGPFATRAAADAARQSVAATVSDARVVELR